MKDAISKLKNTTIATSTASIYYNMYLIKKVYYGCGILTINKSQEKILRKIYEPVILKKMGLSVKFSRDILHTRQMALGVGLMSPKTIMNILALKLYIGHNKFDSDVSKMIKINEENAWLHYGYADEVIDMNNEWQPMIQTWSDEIQSMLRSRNLNIINQFDENK